MNDIPNTEMYHFRYTTDIFVPVVDLTLDEAGRVADAFLGQLLEDDQLAFDDIFRIRIVKTAEHYVPTEFALDVCFGIAEDDDAEVEEEEEE